jgi:hypothetical protein
MLASAPTHNSNCPPESNEGSSFSSSPDLSLGAQGPVILNAVKDLLRLFMLIMLFVALSDVQHRHAQRSHSPRPGLEPGT